MTLRVLASGSSATGSGDDFIVTHLLASGSATGDSHLVAIALAAVCLLPLITSEQFFTNASFITSLQRSRLSAHCGGCFEFCFDSAPKFI